MITLKIIGFVKCSLDWDQHRLVWFMIEVIHFRGLCLRRLRCVDFWVKFNIVE